MENIFTTSQSEDYNNINTDNSITDSPNSSTSYVASDASIGYGTMKGGGEEETNLQQNMQDVMTTKYALQAAENVNNLTENLVDWGENKLLELITSFSDDKLKKLLSNNMDVRSKIEKALDTNKKVFTDNIENKQKGGNKDYKVYYQKYIKYKLKYLSAKYE